MATVHDIAKYILTKVGITTHMKLQKLVYYSQAWALVWDDEQLFQERIEAWANGPVVPVLYKSLRGTFQVDPGAVGGDERTLTTTQRETVDAVLREYGSKSSQWLSDLTHMEAPWIEARKGLGPGDRGCNEITLAAMAEYYGSLI